jgi:Family of unknown function (DUF6074)
MFTRDQLAAWLVQVHADTQLSAHIFKLAFGLTRVADANGFIRSAAVAKLGRDVGDAGEPIADTLGRLIANKHLYAVGDGPKIKGFRLLIRAVNAPLRRRKTAHVIPFPSNRRGAFIRKQADTMAKMSAEKGDAYLRSQLAIQGDSMRRKGIDDLRTDSSTCRRCTGACMAGQPAHRHHQTFRAFCRSAGWRCARGCAFCASSCGASLPSPTTCCCHAWGL